MLGSGRNISDEQTLPICEPSASWLVPSALDS